METVDQFVTLTGDPTHIESAVLSASSNEATGFSGSSCRRDALKAMLVSAAGVVGIGAGFGLLSGCSTSRRGSMTYIPGVWSSRSAQRASGNSPVDHGTPTRRNPRPRVDATPGSGFGTPSQRSIPRSSWTNERLIERLADPMLAIERITVHHDAIDNTGLRSRNDVARRLGSIRAGHLARGWADIGYHFIVDPMGNVWQARPIDWQGAHVKQANPRNLGIMVMGNFMHQRPSVEAMGTLERFLREQMSKFRVPVSRVYTHRELGRTMCPGTNLHNVMMRLRSQSGSLSSSVS